MKWHWGIFVVVLSLLACSEEKKPFFQKKEKERMPFIINMQHFFSEEEQEISFPLWFSDTIIRQHRIETITRTIFFSMNEDSLNKTAIKATKTYRFDKNGGLTDVEVKQFYEGMLVGDITYHYKTAKDEYGYAEVQTEVSKQFVDEDLVKDLAIYQKEKYSDKFLVYHNLGSGDYKFFMLHRQNWGPLSIDSILNPTPNDLIVLGSPQHPRKRYQVENRVNETEVIEYTYDKTGSNVEFIRFDRFPFDVRRTLNYDKLGYCRGFIDSTFTNDRFLTRRVSNFHFQDDLPVKLLHQSESGDAQTSHYQLEDFEYTFYQE